MKPRFEYKPKVIRTLRKMVIDIKQHCEHVAVNPVFGCLTCPYHVDYADGGHACYFEHTGGLKPKDWQMNEMGSCVTERRRKMTDDEKADIFIVYENAKGYEIVSISNRLDKDGLFCGFKRECEKWIEEHKKTWLKEAIAKKNG